MSFPPVALLDRNPPLSGALGEPHFHLLDIYLEKFKKEKLHFSWSTFAKNIFFSVLIRQFI